MAVTAVDRSVHLLEEGNELTEADVSLYIGCMKAAIVKGGESQLLKAQNAHVDQFIQQTIESRYINPHAFLASSDTIIILLN